MFEREMEGDFRDEHERHITSIFDKFETSQDSESIYADSIGSIVDMLNDNTALRSMIHTVASTIYEKDMDHPARLNEEKSVVSSSIESGLAFGAWMYQLGDNPQLSSQVLHSLENTVKTQMRVQTRDHLAHYPTAHFETRAHLVEAEAALTNAPDKEKALVEHFGYKHSYSSREYLKAFRLGYGYIRNAIYNPYDYDTIDLRPVYDLSKMGIIQEMSVLFSAHTALQGIGNDEDDLLDYARRSEAAINAFNDDEKVSTYFKSGQVLSLVSGICKLSNPKKHLNENTQYYSIGESYHRISGTFHSFQSGLQPRPEKVAELQANPTHKLTIAGFEKAYTTELFMRLDNAFITLKDEADGLKRYDLEQTVHIPMGESGQKILYYPHLD